MYTHRFGVFYCDLIWPNALSIQCSCIFISLEFHTRFPACHALWWFNTSNIPLNISVALGQYIMPQNNVYTIILRPEKYKKFVLKGHWIYRKSHTQIYIYIYIYMYIYIYIYIYIYMHIVQEDWLTSGYTHCDIHRFRLMSILPVYKVSMCLCTTSIEEMLACNWSTSMFYATVNNARELLLQHFVNTLDTLVCELSL